MSKAMKAFGGKTTAIMDGLVEAAQQLGVIAATAAKTKTKTKKKKGKKRKFSELQGSVMQGSVKLSNPLVASSSLPRQISIRGNQKPFVVPFDCVGVPIYTNAANPSTSMVFGDTASGLQICPLDVNASIGAGTWSPFGDGMNLLSFAFRLWRVRSLAIEYEPVLPTSSNGSFALGITADGGAINQTFTVKQILSYTGSAIINVGNRTKLQDFKFNSDWRYTSDATTITAAALRETEAGNMMLSQVSPVTVAASQLVGFVRMSGVLEFLDLGSQVTVGTGLNRPIISPSSSSPSSSSSSTNPIVGPSIPLPVLDKALASIHECCRNCECDKEFVNVGGVAKLKL